MPPIFYEDVLRALTSIKAHFLIAGGVAVNLHGVPRMTADLDLLIDLTPANVIAIVGELGRLGYLPRAPVDPKSLADRELRRRWIEEKGMKAFSFFHPKQQFQVVDLLLDVSLTYEEAQTRAFTSVVDELELRIVSLDDLIRMKTAAGRAQDRSDVRALQQVKERRGQ